MSIESLEKNFREVLEGAKEQLESGWHPSHWTMGANTFRSILVKNELDPNDVSNWQIQPCGLPIQFVQPADAGGRIMGVKCTFVEREFPQ